MKVTVLEKMLREKEATLNEMLNQFNMKLGHIQGEISMIKEMLLSLENEEALPSEDEAGE